ncbi:hypothetical protein MMJ53_09645 [Enterococcus cecorum]|uniref:hypothetical protein n=2 Tax=Enterococcus cecorum TaxID=44008 RepID=UPI001FABFA83|nr:hypothetical protein [Enterococcus cecorum]MCJ0552687.1 hypothetical protein [Enterococcus cecorum]MCJ0558451.1 hypothetical protein [Enterococcus cecorum]MCJ0596419.1 hypothetical protein [Enterococcus cecorum]MDZ5531383.1 hypothetical protein [Enterococcus cecorum]
MMDKKIEILNFEKEATLKYLQETIDANYLEMKKGNYYTLDELEQALFYDTPHNTRD